MSEATLGRAVVEVVADTSRFEADLRRRLQQAGRRAGQDFQRGFREGFGDQNLFRDFERNFQESARRAGRGSGREFRRSGEDAGREFGTGFSGALQRLFSSQGANFLEPFLGSIRNIPVLGGALASLGAAGPAGAAALGLIASTAINAAAGLLQFIAAASQVAGILTAIPAAAIATAGVLGTLQLAFSGMSEAIGAALSGDTEKFNAALRGLAPAAQSVAREFQALVPAFNQLKQAVQQNFWKELQGDLTALAKTLGPTLLQGMSGLATTLGSLGSQLARAFATPRAAQTLSVVFQNIREALAALGPAIAPVVNGFLDMARAVAPIFKPIAADIATIATAFGQWMSQISASGQAFSWATTAWNAIKLLTQGLFDLGRAVVNIFAAINGASRQRGENPLQAFADAMRDFADYTASKEGQKNVRDIINVMRELPSLVPGIIAFAKAMSSLGSALDTLSGGGGNFSWLGGLAAALKNMFSGGLLGAGSGLQGALAGFLSGSGLTGGVAKLISGLGQQLAKLGNKAITITASVVGLPQVQALWAAITRIPVSKIVSVIANALGLGAVNALFGAITRIPVTKIASVIARTFGLGAVQTLFAAIMRVPLSRIASVIARTFGLGAVQTLFAWIMRIPLSRIAQIAANVTGLSAVIDLVGWIGRVVSKTVSIAVNVSVGGALGLARRLLGFADGGIVTRPTLGVVGEAGPEVIIPLSKPRRARQLAEQSGLLDILTGGDRTTSRSGGPQTVVNAPVTVNTIATDTTVIAVKTVNRLLAVAGV